MRARGFCPALTLLLATSLLVALLGAGAASASGRAETDVAEVLVVGSEPEGVVAAVAAAEEGARTLLVTRDARLGGLFVRGAMNVLDVRTKPESYQRGLFERWWRLLGRRSAFDVARAEAAFERMLEEAGVEVLRGVQALEPLLHGATVVGLRVHASDGSERTLRGAQLIDASADADLAAQAGARYSLGFGSLGLEARMADSLIFRIDGVDWPELTRAVRARGRGYAEINAHAAWGAFGGYPASYQAQQEGLRLRGLNLGRQDDGSVLVNALLIYGVDPFDDASLAEGFARAAREAPRVVAFLRALPGFAGARFGGVAEALYLRETRHLEARCLLSVDDVLDNVVSERDVVAGGYPLDVQPLTPWDHGFVYGTPEIYGAQLCVTVPVGVEGLWVVGKAAGYDPLAASSARVVPFGMALAEAVGVAAQRAARAGLSPAAFAASPERIAALRARLTERGAYLPAVRTRTPSGPHDHPFWAAYKVLRGRGLALGGYHNDPGLDEAMGALDFAYLLSMVARRFHGDDSLGRGLLASYPAPQGPLTPELALALGHHASCALGRCLGENWALWQALLAGQALAPASFQPSPHMRRGEAYALAAALARLEAVTAEEE